MKRENETELDKECDILHECITKLYNYDINVPHIQECLNKIRVLYGEAPVNYNTPLNQQ